MRENGKLTRTCVAGIAAVGMALAVPGAAAAADGTVGATGTTLTFQAGLATANKLEISGFLRAALGQWYQVREEGVGAALLPATGCNSAVPTNDPVTTATCAGQSITRIVVLLGDQSDTASFLLGVPDTVTTRVNGAAGNDTLGGHGGPDTIQAGPGVNTARGMGGNDRLEMRNGTRDALIDCGEGTADTAVVDKNDPRPVACETVLKPA